MKKHKLMIYVVMWILLVGISFSLQMLQIKNDAKTVAAKQVDEYFATLNLLRQWDLRHPGLSSGLVNPQNQLTITDFADKAKAVQCLAKQYGLAVSNKTAIAFHVSSMESLLPANKADDWEVAALSRFDKSAGSYSEYFSTEQPVFFRYMIPWQLDQGCVACHHQHNGQPTHYGGISVSIPGAGIREYVLDRQLQLLLEHGIVGLIGLLVLRLLFATSKKMLYRLSKAKRQLKLAYLDVLTQLPNRRYYDFFVNKEWKQAMRQGYTLSMIMIDIDYFKIYNDQFGHPQGDVCLQRVAKTLKMYSRRAGDLIARYGGEEFCVVAVCDASQIIQLAEILRKAVEYIQIPHPGSKVSPYVTISLGTATLIPKEGMEFNELLKRADQSLYKAKENGRNRVESFYMEYKEKA